MWVEGLLWPRALCPEGQTESRGPWAPGHRESGGLSSHITQLGAAPGTLVSIHPVALVRVAAQAVGAHGDSRRSWGSGWHQAVGGPPEVPWVEQVLPFREASLHKTGLW